jgi:hypothetical protein
LGEDARVQQAAIIGYTFKQDPLEVTKSDMFDWCFRVAATNYVIEERAKEYKGRHKK